MSVKRYEMKTTYRGHESWDSLEEDEEGSYVDYEDYVALEQKLTDMAVQLANAESKYRELAGLVAENADLKSLIEQHAGSIAVCPNCSHEEPSETDDIVALYRSLKTPATDAFLAEVRAQGVEMYADTLDRGADDAERDGFEDGMKFLRAEAEGVRKFAAQLRKGAAL